MEVPSNSSRILEFALLLFLTASLFPCIECDSTDEKNDKKRRVAIIGGGVSGSFSANYVAEYDVGCALDVVDLYEPSPIARSVREDGRVGVPSAGDPEGPDDDWQGGRVSSLTLADGAVVELGASIIFDGNRLVAEMIENDPDLVVGRPLNPGKEKEESEEGKPSKRGFGVYDGAGEWLVTSSDRRSWVRKMQLLWRYNVDLLRMNHAASRALTSFNLIYELLESDHPASFIQSADEMWDAVGLLKPATVSFDDFLDAIGVCREVPWWRRLLPRQGCIRNELLAAANINNYNQENWKMNGLAGLVSFVPTKGQLFSIEGGNHQLIHSAFKQAKQKHGVACGSDAESRIRHVQKRVTAVVSELEEGMELFSGEESLGHYDVVILAAPLQFSKVDFLKRSHRDDAVLEPMPLGGSVDADAVDADERRRGAPPLPSSASRRYTQVVTTVITNGVLQREYFNVTEAAELPRSIYFSERGKKLEGITTISHVTSDGVFKMFSCNKVPREKLQKIFGPSHKVEYEKVWGGEHGGATPDFAGGGEASASTPYLLYDGGLGTKGHGDGPALYYVNSIEAAVSAVEVVAIGAKSVAKLVAQRFGLIAPSSSHGDGEL